MTLNELIEKLTEQQLKGYGNYEVFAVTAHDMIEPNGDVVAKLCEHEIYIRGDLV